MPYHMMAITALIRAGILAPQTPKLIRLTTGNGTPWRWPILPIQFMPM